MEGPTSFWLPFSTIVGRSWLTGITTTAIAVVSTVVKDPHLSCSRDGPLRPLWTTSVSLVAMGPWGVPSTPKWGPTYTRERSPAGLYTHTYTYSRERTRIHEHTNESYFRRCFSTVTLNIIFQLHQSKHRCSLIRHSIDQSFRFKVGGRYLYKTSPRIVKIMSHWRLKFHMLPPNFIRYLKK